MKYLNAPSADQLMESMLDICSPKHGVEVSLSENGKVVWVNIDGVCVLRIIDSPVLIIKNPPMCCQDESLEISGAISGTTTGRVSGSVPNLTEVERNAAQASAFVKNYGGSPSRVFIAAATNQIASQCAVDINADRWSYIGDGHGLKGLGKGAIIVVHPTFSISGAEGLNLEARGAVLVNPKAFKAIRNRG